MSIDLLIPVKELQRAKSRLLLPTIVSHAKTSLVLAMLTDVLQAAIAAPRTGRVVVVTPDAVVAAVAQRCGASVLREGPSMGLNESISRAVDAQSHRAAIGILLADLPCLRSEELDEDLLAAAEHDRVVCPDRNGNGTVFLGLGRRPDVYTTVFGRGSYARHSEAGFRTVLTRSIRSRHDVDTYRDLLTARTFGLGPTTADWCTRFVPR
ncbi:2-phospho-L-lactate guanylyltransferase [Rhodococcus sp. T2V]|uniref:2-phospho-L-lactate guanylyltransferase n=1 Tax=Rhodococcus sp. T2V TaxID=3034164 RepID=UPI0023E22932|nr:2-phospho-L-lactate guanylyltransferase [Rhodococcus sp. T2V]MDF3311842.1 2-phospho-L-lactate guanylyltransferase [Rhodococcus sp. T2V]